MIKFKNGDRDKLKQIQKLLEKADTIYSQLDNQTRQICCDYHNNEGSLPHCLYFGITACEELLDKRAKIDE